MSDAIADDAAPTAEEAAAEARILAHLDALGAAVEMHRHRAVFTVEESEAHTAHIEGLHVKNLFFKDKKGGLRLVTCLDRRKIRIRDLEKALGWPKLSFGKPELLWETLSVRPGAVTPLALLADKAAGRVNFAYDAALAGADRVCCHPLHNKATIVLSFADLARFWADTGHDAAPVDFDALEAAASRA